MTANKTFLLPEALTYSHTGRPLVVLFQGLQGDTEDRTWSMMHAQPRLTLATTQLRPKSSQYLMCGFLLPHHPYWRHEKDRNPRQ